MIRRGSITLALVLGVLLLAPATAPATTYCVSDPACVTAGGTDQATLGQALSAATGNAGGDRIEIGAGTFDEAASVGTFLYLHPDPLEIVGAGVDQTILTDSGTSPGAFEAILILNSAAATVRDLTARVATTSERGIQLSGGATATGVEADSTGSPADVNAIVISNGGTLEDSQINLGGSDSNSGMNVIGSEDATVEDVTISAPQGISSSAPAAYRRVQITVADQGLTVAGNSATIDSSLIRTTDLGSDGINVNNTNMLPTTFGLTARNLTLIGPGDSGEGASVFAGDVVNQEPFLTLRHSIVAGYAAPLGCSDTGAGSATLTTDHSNYANVTVSPSCTFTEASHTDVDPMFLSAATNDYRLLGSSPLIDAGTAAPIAADESPTDLDGNPRLVDGDGDGTAARDLGAYEAEALAPPPETFDGTLKLRFAPATSKFKGRLTSESDACLGARKVTIMRKAGGRRRAVGRKRTDAAGRFKLKRRDPAPGRYFAQAGAKQLPNGDTCAKARSKGIRVR